MITDKIQWFARYNGVVRMGPYPSQVRAVQAVTTTEGEPSPGAFTWPEEKPTKRAGSRSRKAA